MNFQQLEYALAVHQHQHFGMAAESCGVTQATLSGMIKKLEEELGVILFDRSRKPVVTSDVGVEFIKTARLILEEKEKLKYLGKTKNPMKGDLIIAIIPTIANTLLPLLLPALTKKHPELKLKIREITTQEIKHQLARDKIDLGILATPIEDERYEEHILYYEPMMIYGIESSDKKFLSSEDVRNKKIWLLEEGHCFGNQTKTICKIKEKELVNANLDFRGSSFETLLNLSNKYGGYTLVPELYYYFMEPKRRAKTVKFQKPIPVREVSIITYRQHAKTRTIHQLSELIKELVEPKLSTKEYQNHELEIIGI